MPSFRRFSLGSCAALLAGCAVGPNYHRPEVAAPASFKEASADWRPAAPGDAAPRGSWWQAYQDPVLNDLEAQAAAANQTLQQAAANYEQAREVARADRATLLPSIDAVGTAERARASSGRSISSGAGSSTSVVTPGGSAPTNTFSAELQGTWTPDFWGRIRRQVQADVAAAQASAADLANARLSVLAVLAQDYLQLRVLDRRKELLDDATAAYARTLEISRNRYGVGVAGRSDVLSAQAQLDATRAQALEVGVQRAADEHAIAVLVGRAPADFSLAPRARAGLPVPAVPGLLPSDLLERRPDVAASERAVVEANARVGVQTAAYFPDISLSAAGGFEGSVLHRLFEAPNRLWSVGGNVSEALIDFGARRAALREAKAAYEGSVAAYRQTVLTAFQQVEDGLSGLRILGQEQAIQDSAVSEAAQASAIALNEYRAGTADYTTVVTALVAEVNDREAALTTTQSRLSATVSLIEALGGGWQASDLPGRGQVLSRSGK